jgi:methyltransferase family protein
MLSFLRDPRDRLLERMPQNGVCAEVGVWQGAFSQKILTRTKPRSLHLIDPWAFAPEFPQRWYGGAKASNQVQMDEICEQVRSKFANRPEVSVHRMSSVAAAANFSDRQFDWVYIDGDHSRAAVLADLEAWYPKVRKGGFVTGDDYHWIDEAGLPSVKLAVQEFTRRKRIVPTLIRTQFMLQVDV